MSGECFDIFADMQSLQKRIYSMPKQINEVPTEPDTEIEHYFDSVFLDASSSSSKTKEKTEAKKKSTRNIRGRDDTAAETNATNYNREVATPIPSPQKLPELDEPPLSPLSQMLRDEEQLLLEDAEKGPVSRRLRSSIGSRNKARTEELNDQNTTISSKRVGRGLRKNRTQSKPNATVTEEPANSLLNSIDFTASSSTRNVNRARRKYFSEKAARATNVDYIDLVSAVQPRVEGYICLDDEETVDGELVSATLRTTDKPLSADQLNSSFDADNPEISVKIRWHGNYEKYSLRKYQKFSHIMEQISARENVPITDIVFNLNDKFVKAHDTPDSIGYKAYHFIDGRAMKFRSPEIANNTKSKLMSDMKGSRIKQFQLKVQSDKLKRPLVFEMKKSDTFKILYIKCAEEFKAALVQLKLSFDGETLDYADTPEKLELEGGEVIDLRIK